MSFLETRIAGLNNSRPIYHRHWRQLILWGLHPLKQRQCLLCARSGTWRRIDIFGGIGKTIQYSRVAFRQNMIAAKVKLPFGVWENAQVWPRKGHIQISLACSRRQTRSIMLFPGACIAIRSSENCWPSTGGAHQRSFHIILWRHPSGLGRRRSTNALVCVVALFQGLETTEISIENLDDDALGM